MKEGWKRI